MHLAEDDDDDDDAFALPDEIREQMEFAEHVSYQFDPNARARDLCATSEMSRPPPETE